jgi:hypothetical protein
MDVVDQALADTASAVTDGTSTVFKLAESAVKKAWSVLDAASQKQTPSEYLSQQAIQSMQGKTTQG